MSLGRLAGNTLTYGVGSVLSRLVSLLLLPLFTSYLSPSDYGVISILGIMGLIAMPIFSLGLGAGMGPCYFQDDSDEYRGTITWTAAMVLVLSVTALCFGSSILSGYLSELAFQTAKNSRLVSLSLWTIGANILAIPFTLRLQFEERARLYVALSLLSITITLGLTVVAVSVLELGVLGYVGSMFIGQVFNLLLFLFPSALHLRFRISRKAGIELLRLGLPLVPSFAFLFVLQQSNKFILQIQTGIESVGIYTIGFNLGMVMGVIVGAFQTAWYPFFISFINRQVEARHPFSRIFTYYVLGIGGLTVVFFATARLLTMIMTNNSFHDAYVVIGPSAAAQFFMGLFYLALPGVYFSKEVKGVSIVQGMAAVLSVLLNLIFIGSFGVAGAALALMIGHLLVFILMYIWNVRKGYFQVKYEWHRINRVFLVYSAICVISIWQRSWGTTVEIMYTGAILLLFACSLWWLMTRSEREFLVGRIRSIGLKAPSI